MIDSKMLFLFAVVALGCGTVRADLADFVDPFIGTAGTGHTTPAACLPFGMVQAGADTGYSGWEHCSGYIYGERAICGFTQTHVNGTGCHDLCDVRILAFRGESADPIPFEHADEIATPGFYAVDLKSIGVTVEVVPTAHAAIYRLTTKKDGELKLLVESKSMFGKSTPIAQDVGETGLAGTYRSKGWSDRTVSYAIEFNRKAKAAREDVFSFNLKSGETLMVKVGLSVGTAGAASRNLKAEIPAWDFDAVKHAARRKWNEVLGVAVVEGADEQKKNWYTSLYHLCVQPNNIADVGMKPFYSTFSCWDTFRAAGPLYTILYPGKVVEFVDSMLEQCRRTGFLPIWALWGHDNQCMIGTHSVPMIVDCFLKGGEGDWENAYAQIKATLTKPHIGRSKERWDLYDRHGYYPYDLVRAESVSRTLECTYDDWCAGVMAERLGHKKDAEFFFKRAGYWKNVFDPEIGFMRGKDAKGAWQIPFNPYAIGGGEERENCFTEGNSYQYTWHVLQDPAGLIAAMGGDAMFVKRLDGLFSQPEKVDGMGEREDVTGLIGQYAHGNEPSHHVAYFYSLSGRPDRTAEVVREIFDRFYLPKPDGLCGNDDCGQMSAWYIFSAMGFYPFNPCGGEYIIGAPQVEKVTLRCTPKPNTYTSFTVIAKGLSKENKYVKSVTLNGKPIADWKIRHADILKGGELVFEMTDVY